MKHPKSKFEADRIEHGEHLSVRTDPLAFQYNFLLLPSVSFKPPVSMQMFILRVYNIKYQPPYRPIEPHSDEHEEFSHM